MLKPMMPSRPSATVRGDPRHSSVRVCFWAHRGAAFLALGYPDLLGTEATQENAEAGAEASWRASQ
jgi:hypothetical protein